MMFLNMSGQMPTQIASGYQKTETTPEAIRHMQSQTSAIVVMMLSFMDYYICICFVQGLVVTYEITFGSCR